MNILTFLWSAGIVGLGLFGLYEMVGAVAVLFEADDE